MNLAEDMRAHSTKWSGIAFTAPMKAQLAGDLRELFQTKTIQIPQTASSNATCTRCSAS